MCPSAHRIKAYNNIFNPFIFIKNKHHVVSSEGFSALEKNAVIWSQRAMLPIHPTTDSNVRLVQFFKNLNKGSGVAARC
jgi:hypothetical protein